MSKGFKLVGLIASVSVINVFVLSPGLLGIKIGGESAIQTAFGISTLTASLLVLLYGIHGLFFKPVKGIPLKEIKINDDYVHALSFYLKSNVLKNDISFTLQQIERLNKKKETFASLLNDRFSPDELSFQKFTSVISEVEKLFYINLKNILNKISTFDEKEYKSIMGKDSSRYSKKILQEKTLLYNEYLSFVKNSININEEILLNLDKLLLEISRLDSFEIEDLNNLNCMQEIDSLIKQTKYYKH